MDSARRTPEEGRCCTVLEEEQEEQGGRGLVAFGHTEPGYS